ncbi:hypothetical protein [Friedmanniella luteola]|nr:hypothetical protein [Friedmanniella luteola]
MAVIAVLTAAPVISGKLQALGVACVLLLPFVPRAVLRDRLVQLLCLTLALWGAGQLVSDEWNGLGPRLSRHFISAMAMLCIVPVLVFLARGDFRRMRAVIAGVAAGLVLETLLVEHASITSTISWKFGLNSPVAIFVLALTDLAWHRGRRLPSVVALVFICLVGVATDHRHLAGVALLTAIVLLVRNRQRHPRTISVLAGLTLLLAALSGAFIQGSEAGVLGERSGGQIAKFGGTPQSIFVNVRPEPFQEFYLFTQRPTLGWGSLPRVDSAAYLGSKEFLRQLGVVRQDLDDIWLHLDVPGVSSHSQAMDSLARGGLSAAPFWLLLLGLAMLVGTQAIRFRSSPLVVLWTILVLWDAICSPLSGLSHIELGAYMALAVTSLRHAPPTVPRVD